MKSLLLWTSLLVLSNGILHAGYRSSESPITPAVKKRMIAGHSWHRGCPVALSDLRYLRMSYRGFDGKDHFGEMIVHRSVASDVRKIFGELYRMKYPIRRMRLVSDYKGSDYASIEADNTSAFNCRNATGSGKWSRHAYGKAIDLNPLENPYVSRSGHIAHKASLPYAKRTRRNPFKPENRAVLLRGGPVVTLFKKHGWRWGGDWHSIKDYQHFEK